MSEPCPIDLLTVGSVAYDTIETRDHIAERVMGGSASFFGVAAANLCKTGIVGVVGDDYRPEDLRLLADAGVHTDGVAQRPGKTFFWRGRYDDDLSSRTSLQTELGVFEDFDPVVPDALRSVPFLFLANIAPALQLKVLDQVKAPRFVGMDTMDFWIHGNRDDLLAVLARVDAIFINNEESLLLTGEENLLRSARKLQEMGPRVVVIKKGEHGALLVAENELFSPPACLLDNVQDPTGAGDTFAGGFMGYLASREQLEADDFRKATMMGILMASFCVERFSLQGLLELTRPKIEQRYQDLRALIRVDPWL
jgi:sugar/nucleoside kinase (ribokinase family)